MKKDPFITCKTCGGKMAKTAKACPHCGAPNKKPFYKRPAFWVGVTVIGVGAVACKFALKNAARKKLKEALIKKVLLRN